ncbi:hypothetical protein [Streptomyces ossamyceticus]|uniref:hypothetical protein n=1 Tax=Streptomyces ossamyceticus TaxID=249581 RepID=UPI0006E27991|nr:hypothetical protein [Streptomyces ossamyceticus]
MSARIELPPVEQLSSGQFRGLNCVWCGVKLTTGAVSAGIARGRSGAHILDTEVWSCPNCVSVPVPDREPGDHQ